jgi:hypothetical protein
MNIAGETSKIAPAGEASAKPQKLTGSPVAGAVYVPEDDEVYFLTPSQWKAANREAEESDKCIRDFIEKVENGATDEAAKAGLEKARQDAGKKIKKIKALVDGVDSKKKLTEIHYLTGGRPGIAFVSQEQKEKWRAPASPENRSSLSQRDRRTLERKGEKGLEDKLRYREKQATRKEAAKGAQREQARQKRDIEKRSWFKRDEKGNRTLKRETGAIKEKLLVAEIALKAEWRKDGNVFDWEPIKKTFVEGKSYDVKGTAQAMRYTAGASAGLLFDPAKMVIKMKGEAKASFAICEGELTTSYYFPNHDGWPLEAHRSGAIIQLCSLRFSAYVKFQGFLGANAAISAQLGFEPDKATRQFVPIGIERSPRNSKDEPTRDGGLLEASAFVGGQVSGTIGGVLEWRSTATENQWKDLAKCEYSAGLAGGLGFEGACRVLYEGGKFIVYAQLKVVVGVGLSGGISFSVNARQIYQFIRFLYDELRRNDFGFVEWISQEAFEHWSAILYYTFTGVGGLVLEQMAGSFSKARKTWNEHVLEQESVRQLASSICRDPSLLVFATPETRGRMLYHLTDPGLLTDLGFLWNGDERREAMIKIFETIQSRREWNKTLRSVVPGKGQWLGPNGDQDQEVFAMGRLSKLIDSSIHQRYYAWISALPDTETHLRENVSKAPEKVNRWQATRA